MLQLTAAYGFDKYKTGKMNSLSLHYVEGRWQKKGKSKQQLRKAVKLGLQSATAQLGDFGQVLHLSEPQFPLGPKSLPGKVLRIRCKNNPESWPGYHSTRC